MSRIFISHATADNAKTCAVIDWIASRGWSREDIFVDFDLTNGIAGGERWREALERALKRCETCIFLISPAWADSDWCPGEATAAQLLGKQIIPVLIEPTPFDRYGPLLTHEYQLIDLTLAGPRRSFEIVMPGSGHTETVELVESGLQALRVGLERAGLAPSTFPLVPGRPIYPGLAPLDIDDAAVFFGRDAEIDRGLKELRLTRDRGECLLAILAASGAGKSSFLRAGLWPRLQRADTEFLILPVLRPGTHALEALVASLHGAGEALELKRNRADWRAQLEQGDLAGALSLLQTAARSRLPAAVLARTQPASTQSASTQSVSTKSLSTKSASRPESDSQADLSQTHPNSEHAATAPIPVLPIDQAEELFGPQGGEPARRVLDLLGAALREGRLIALCAIRTDRYASLQTAPALAGLTQRPFSLPPIVEGTLKDVIEGPALRDQKANGAKGLRIDAQLTDRLLHDWADTDGLPLLAFTLRRLLDDYGSDGTLTPKDYEDSGQLRGALEAAIGRAMQAATAAGTLPEGSQEREALIRKTFVPLLVSVDPQSQKPLRRIALRSELPAETRDLIDRLIDARLLTCDRPQDSDATVEVAHEAILHHWPLLDRIICQEREALIVLNEVKRDAEGWHASKKSDDALESDDALLHRGERLRHADQHLAREDFQSALGDDGRRYLAACRARETQEFEDKLLQQAREAAQISRTRTLQRRATVLLASVVVVIVIAGVFLTRLQKTTNQASADVLASLASQAFDRHEYDRAVRFALAGVRKRDATLQAIDISAAENQLQRAGYRSSLRVIFAHKNKVVAASVSPDGRRVVTASGNAARLWEAASGKLIATMRHDGLVRSAAFSPDGRRIVTASSDNTARLWQADSETPLATMRHDEPVISAAFSADGRRIFTTTITSADFWDAVSGQTLDSLVLTQQSDTIAISPDGRRIVTVTGWRRIPQLWDAASRQPPATLMTDSLVFSAAFSPDGMRIVTTSADKTARLWDATSGQKLATLQHDDGVQSAAFSPDGRRIVTVPTSGDTAHLWDAASGQKAATLQHDADATVTSASFSPDGRHIVTTSGYTARFWDAASGQTLAILQHNDIVVSAAFSLDGRRIVTASWDNTARFWDVEYGQTLATLQHDDQVSSAAFSTDSRRIVTSSMDKTARIWDAVSGQTIATLKHSEMIESAALSPDGRRIVTFPIWGDTAHLWDAASGQTIATLQNDADTSVTSAIFSPDGSRILTVSFSNTARLWDAASGRKLATLQHDKPIFNAAFSPDGGRIVTASWDKTARLWDVASGQMLAALQHDVAVNIVAFSHDGRRIFTTSGNTARLWDAVSHQTIATLKHGDMIESAALRPDDRRIVFTSDDNIARIWDAASGQTLATLQHDKDVTSAAFSPDGRRILTVSDDNTARLWDAAYGQTLATLQHNGPVESAAFNLDGRSIVTASKDHTARIWDVGVFLLNDHKLIDTICRDILNVNINAPPRKLDLSRLTDEELQMAAVINPNTERDVCRPPSRWQRFASMFGIGG